MILLARSNRDESQNLAHEEAGRILEQAIEVAASQHTRLFGLRATVELCRLWLTTGKRKQARQRLTEVLGTFDEGSGETDLREAQALLDELG